jgi:hypothetical protein
MTKAKQVIEEEIEDSIEEEIELTANEHNQLIWAEIEKYQDEIELMKLELRPAELPKQVSLNDCNIMAGKIKLEVSKVDPKRLQEERTGA